MREEIEIVKDLVKALENRIMTLEAVLEANSIHTVPEEPSEFLGKE